MQKILLSITVLLLSISCGNRKTDDEVAFQLGLVTDIGGIDDRSFNEGTWEGIIEFATDFEMDETDYRFLQSEAEADYIPNLSTFAEDLVDLIIAPGFLFSDAIGEAADMYPDQNFLIIDTVVERPNVVSAIFAEEEGSFLVGVASALKTQEAGNDSVGFIGGMDFPLIQKFEAGFEAGVKAVDPNMTVLIEYVGDFANPQMGQTIASKFYDSGVYVIYHAAGSTGNGVIKEAKDRALSGQDVWVVGVDKDQYAEGIYQDNKSVILTSMVKRVDVASYDVAKQVYDGEFSGGIIEFDLVDNGVSLPEENPNITDEWLAIIDDFRDRIIANEINPPKTPERLR